MNFSSVFFLLFVVICAFVSCTEELNAADAKSIEQRHDLNHRFARGQAKRSWSMSRGGFGRGFGRGFGMPYGGYGMGYGGGYGGWGYGK